MITAFTPPNEFVPQLTPLMSYQQSWWRDNFRLPEPPTRKLSAEQPLTYDEAEAIRNWQRDADDVVHRYETFVATEDGQRLIAELDSSRQQAIKTDGAPFVAFLRDTRHPGIALLKTQTRLLLAEYGRELSARPPETEGFGENGETIENVYRDHFAKRADAIDKLEERLCRAYTAYAEAVSLIAEARAAMAEVRKIPRTLIHEFYRSEVRVEDTVEKYLARRRQYAY